MGAQLDGAAFARSKLCHHDGHRCARPKEPNLGGGEPPHTPRATAGTPWAQPVPRAAREPPAALADADESVPGCHRRYGWAASARGERRADTADVEGASALPSPD